MAANESRSGSSLRCHLDHRHATNMSIGGCFVLAEALVAILLALAAIIATASVAAVTALGVALGVSATVGLASAS